MQANSDETLGKLMDKPNAYLDSVFQDIPCISNDAERTKKKTGQMMSYVSNIITSMRGDIMGDYVYCSIRGENAGLEGGVRKLKARIDPWLFVMTLNILRSMFDVRCIMHGRKWIIMPYWDCEREDRFESFEIVFDIMPKDRWRCQTMLFDIDKLVFDSFNLYIRAPSVELHPSRNRLEYHLQRAVKKEFCLAEIRDHRMTPEQMYYHFTEALKKSYKRVKQGWHMDDSQLGYTSFVVARWSKLVHAFASIRKRCCQEAKYEQAVGHGTCSLCHESFEQDAIVVNLACNHTFHYMCCTQQSQDTSSNPVTTSCTGGIHTWLLEKGNNSCPLCRESITTIRHSV